MNKNAHSQFCIRLKRSLAPWPLLVSCAGVCMLLAGRGIAGNDTTRTETLPSSSPQARSAESPSSNRIASKPSDNTPKQGTQDLQRLAGRPADEVEAALGKPSGKLQTAQGALWLYSHCRVQFDHDSH